MRLVGVGGPFDGHVFELRSCGHVVWIDEAQRCHARPGEGRWPYRRAGRRLEFAGFGARCCGGCGAIVSANPSTGGVLLACPLCGTGL